LYALLIISGGLFATTLIQARDLQAHLEHATFYQNYAKIHSIQELIATEQRKYDYLGINLNGLVNVQPIGFWDWLRQNYAAAPQ